MGRSGRESTQGAQTVGRAKASQVAEALLFIEHTMMRRADNGTCSSKARMGPNVEGNRRADEMVTEDQGVCRRVRLTVVLGPSVHDADRVAEGRDTARSLML